MKLTEYDIELNENRLPVLKEKKMDEYEKLDSIRTAKHVDMVLRDVYNADKKAEEHVWILAFNTANELIGVFDACHGTVNYSMISMREIYMRLLLCGAVRFAIAHNHPSGDTTPSKQDIEFVNDMLKTSEIMNIEMNDNIIIGDDYFSFRENGFIKK